MSNMKGHNRILFLSFYAEHLVSIVNKNQMCLPLNKGWYGTFTM